MELPPPNPVIVDFPPLVPQTIILILLALLVLLLLLAFINADKKK